jgi:hypothetical protein
MTTTEAIQIVRQRVKELDEKLAHENITILADAERIREAMLLREAILLLADVAAKGLLLPNMRQKPIHTADGGRLTTLRKRGPR